MNQLNKLKSLLASAEEDATKFFIKGNNAAGTRLRGTLQDIKKECKDIRELVTQTKKGTLAASEGAIESND